MSDTVYRVEMIVFQPDVVENTSFDTMKEAVTWANEHVSEYDAYDVYAIDVNTLKEDCVWSDKREAWVKSVWAGVKAGRKNR